MLFDNLARLCNEFLDEGRSADAVAACDKALAGNLTRARKAQVLQLKAKILVTRDGMWDGPSINCLKEALEYAAKNSPEMGRVLISFTAAYAYLARPSLCREYRDAFLLLLRQNETPDLAKFRPAVEYNLGLSYHEVDDFDNAEDAYLVARALCAKSDDPEVRS